MIKPSDQIKEFYHFEECGKTIGTRHEHCPENCEFGRSTIEEGMLKMLDKQQEQIEALEKQIRELQPTCESYGFKHKTPGLCEKCHYYTDF